MKLTRQQVLRHRVHVQALDREPGSAQDAEILDLGAQDTGPDGARWALALRGYDADWADLVLLWTLRGAPHAYRRQDVAQVVAAVAPLDSDDGARRILAASKPLRAAGIDPVEAVATIGETMRGIAATPLSKGALSSAVTEAMPPPFLRWCGPCGAAHVFEMPFRFGATAGGLSLEPETSPPMLHRLPRWKGPATRIRPVLQPIRGVLHLLGPSTPKEVAAYLDAAARSVLAHWPDDTVEVEVDGEPKQVLADDLEAAADPPRSEITRLLGPFDLFLQGRDRTLLVGEAARHKDLWRTLGRPGAILHGHEIGGTWRPRTKGPRLAIQTDLWRPVPVTAIDEQGERLAAFRGLRYAGRT